MAQQYSNNLWEVVCFEDLLYFLRKSKNSHIMLGMVLQSTDDDIKSLIRSFLKNKSKIFPNVTFLYFVVRSKDMGKLNGMIDKDESKYPFIYNVYNVHDILIKTCNIESYDDLVSSFSEIEQDYIIHKKHFVVQHQKSESEDLSSGNHTSNDDSVLTQTQQMEKIKEQMKKQMETQAEQQQQNLSDKKRLLDKILLLKTIGEQYQLDFVQDIAKRKKEEEKNDGSKKKKH